MQILETEHLETVNIRKSFIITGLFGLLAALTGATSCNKDSTSETYLTPSTLAVTEFSLQADAKNPGLDSAYFSIDLEHGVIFNADSLRKGTKIDKVVANITFRSTVSEATIVMSGGTTREGELDYQKNPTDSIDFTGDVWLRLKSDDGQIGTTYRLKVNVHKETPDTLIWSPVDNHPSISRLSSPKAMKTVQLGGTTMTMVEESDGTYTATRLHSFETFEMLKTPLQLSFTPQIATLRATGDRAWILDTDGNLWEGDKSLELWSRTPETWTAMIGGYMETVIGVRSDSGHNVFAQYPAAELVSAPLPADFPLEGMSDFVTLTNKWTSSPVAFFTGGVKPDGSYSDATWAFDGSEWIKLSQGGMPALRGASLIPYINYRPSADGKSMVEYPVWMLTGGRHSDGEFNRTVYVSYDNGVNWQKGTASLQWPENLPSLVDCDNIVISLELSGNLSDAWTRTHVAARVSFTTNGYEVTWQCPYIFMLGGYRTDGSLNTQIWRGVLNRLTFIPIV